MSQEPRKRKVADHFKEDTAPSVSKTYKKLIDVVRKFGPVAEAAKKTSIHLDNKTAFAAVYVRRNYINLVVKADHQIISPRVQKTEHTSGRRFYHTVKLASEADIDKELIGWVKDAYILSK